MKLSQALPLVLAVMTLNAAACTKSGNATSSLKTADDDYYAAARAYDDAANRINENAGKLADAAGQTDEETRKVQDQIGSARSFLQNLNSSITAVDSSRRQAESDRLRYEADEARYNSQAADYAQRTDVLLKEVRNITQQVYVLENKIAIKAEQKENLAGFSKSLQDYANLFDSFSSAATEMQSLARAAEQQHTDWMKQFEMLSTQMKPNFASIVDIDSFRNALTSINDFRSKIPSAGQLRGLETRYSSSRENFLVTSQQLRDLGHKIASSRDLSVYLNFYPDSKIAAQMDEVERLTRDVRAVSLEQVKFHDARNERRVYLSTMVPVAWEKLAKVNLQLNNETIGLDLIRQVETIISSQYVYNSFLKKVNDGRTEFYNFQRTLFAPRRAGFIVSDMLDYLAKLEAPELLNALSPEMKSQIVAEVKDAKAEWLRNRAETIASLKPNKLATYLKEWQRQTKIMAGRLKPIALPDCHKAVSQINASTSGDTMTEEAFVLLKTGC